METKVCIVCNLEQSRSSFKSNPDGSIRRHACNKCLGKRERKRQQIDFLNAYGWKCSCCGEDDPRFLSLDHVQNDGASHRENLNGQQIMYQAKREGYPKDKYECLCYTCNLGRSTNGGICPHKDIPKQEYIQEMHNSQFKTGREHVLANTDNIAARVAGRKQQAKDLRQVKIIDYLKTLTPEQMLEIANQVKV